MAVESTNVPVASTPNGAWPNEDIFKAVMEARHEDPTFEIKVNHPLYYYYKENNLINYVSDWETYKPVDLVSRENSTVKDFAHYDDVDYTPQDVLEQAKFGNGYIIGTQVYSHTEMLTLNTKTRVIDLAKTKETQLVETMTNHFAGKIIGTQDADGRVACGIGRIVTPDVACGGIDPTTPGYAYWNAQKMLKPAGTQFSLATEFRAGLRRLERLCTYQGERPRFYLCGEDVYEAWCAYVESKTGYLNPGDMKKQKEWTDFNMHMEQSGRIFVYDASLAAKEVWLINTNRTKIEMHSGANFTFEPWEKIPGKMAKKRECLIAYRIYTSRRNANGRGVFS